jgi:hypothetical protein
MPTKKKKSSRSWSKGDTIFLAAVLTVVFPTSSILQKSLDTSGGTGTTQAIGTITFKQKVAERKFSSQSLWGQVASKSPVYNFDTIRTGSGASAVVNLDDGTEINLDEETMVGLEVRQKAFSAVLVTGGIAAKRKPRSGETAFSVHFNGVGVAIDNGSVTIGRQGDSLLMQSDSAVKITSGGKTSTLENDQAVLVAPGAPPVVQPQTVELVEPQAGAYIVGVDEFQPVAFRWHSGDPGSASTVQVSPSSSFSSIYREAGTDQSELHIKLPRGSFYWRVVPQHGAPSLSRRVVVVEGAAPTPLGPTGVHQVADPATALVPFSWTVAPNAGLYRLEVFDASRSGAPIRTLSTSVNGLSISGLSEGHYRWRVVGLYPFANTELAGDNQEFEVQKLQKLAAPEPSNGNGSALVETRTQFSVLDKAASVLGWDVVPSAQAYEVIIAKDPEFKQIVSRSTTESNFIHRPADLGVGDYYWRVRAVSKDLVSDPSAARSFSLVASLPLTALAPKAEIPSRQALRAVWNDPNWGQRYRIEISADQGFSSIAGSQEVTLDSPGLSRSADLAWTKPGPYFWRVSLLNNGGAVKATSPPLAFILAGGLTPPQILEPRVGSALELNTMASLVFRWTPVAQANRYRFALYRTVAGSSKFVLDALTSKNSFTLGRWDLLSLDSYVWTITAVTVENGKDFQTSGEVQGSFFLTKTKSLMAPIARIPKIIYLAPESP